MERPGYWQLLVEHMRLIFSRSTHQREVQARLASMDPEDLYSQIILYLAMSCVSDVHLDDAATTQALITPLVGQIGAVGPFLNRAFARWIIEYWRGVASRQGFRLTVPILLRNELVPIPEDSASMADVALVLLAAETATSARFPVEVREQLRNLSGRSA